ncbi:MAG: hypothetical protein JSR80_07620 [Verrucomicrobia bacterium]|nr:hypothetical protein [Verrucomicrobiota bacterium]
MQVGASPRLPPLPPPPQQNSSYVPMKELFLLVDQLKARFPKIDFGEIAVHQVGMGTIAVISDLVTVRVSGLEGFEEKLKELFQEQQEIGQKRDDLLSREAKVRKLQTSLALSSSVIMGIGGVLTGGVVGAVLFMGCLLNGAHLLMRQSGVYHEMGKSLASTEESQRQMGLALENGVGFVCFAAACASACVGGADPLIKGFTEATEVTLHATSSIGIAAKGLADFQGARLSQNRLEFEIEDLGCNLQITMYRYAREETEELVYDALKRMSERVEEGGNRLKNAFELSSELARNIGETR